MQASQGSQLFNYIQSITSYLAPPICAVYLLAIFWPRTNEPGAFWGLMLGLVIGLVRFGLEFSISPPACGDHEAAAPPQWWEEIVGQVHYLHFGLLLCFISGRDVNGTIFHNILSRLPRILCREISLTACSDPRPDHGGRVAGDPAPAPGQPPPADLLVPPLGGGQGGAAGGRGQHGGAS